MAALLAYPATQVTSEQLLKCQESNQSMLLGLTWSLLVLATVAVTCRFGLRVRLRNGIQADDHFILAALVSYPVIRRRSRSMELQF